MGIREFAFEPELTDQFIRLGYELYKEDPSWIPPLKRELCRQLNPDFCFFRYPGNSHLHFLARLDGRIVGRATAMVNADLKDADGSRVATIGFFECIEDFAVAEDLLHSALRWIVEKHGIRRVWGPMNFDIWHSYRFMTKGFGEELFYGEPYNKPYYPEFFERFGFSPKRQWHSLEVKDRTVLEWMKCRGEERRRELVARGYRFAELNPRKFNDEIQKLHGVLRRSFNGFLGFTPVPLSEFERLFRSIRCWFDPRLFTFVYDEAGMLVGFSIAVLDLSSAVCSMRGQSNVLSGLRMMILRRRAHRVLYYMGGLIPEEAVKLSGLGRAGFSHTIGQILDAGYEKVVIALMSDVSRARGLLGGWAVNAQRQYTLYERIV